MEVTGGLNETEINTSTQKGRKELYKAFTYWVVCEGTFFFSGFAMLLALSDKIPGIAEQIQYTLRDESIHIKFGTTLLNKLREQYPDIMTDKFESELTKF